MTIVHIVAITLGSALIGFVLGAMAYWRCSRKGVRGRPAGPASAGDSRDAFSSIRPCPLCNRDVEVFPAPPRLDGAPSGFNVRCRCGAMGHRKATIDEAIRAWNEVG